MCEGEEYRCGAAEGGHAGAGARSRALHLGRMCFQSFVCALEDVVRGQRPAAFVPLRTLLSALDL